VVELQDYVLKTVVPGNRTSPSYKTCLSKYQKYYGKVNDQRPTIVNNPLPNNSDWFFDH